MFRRVRRERYLSPPELDRFMRAVRERRHVNATRDYALFALLANTGMRPAEVRSLTVGDFDLSRSLVRLNRTSKKHTPQPLGHLVLQREVAAIVGRYLVTIATDPSTLLFPFTKRQGARLFHYYAGKAGIRSTLRIYSLRHTVGIRLWDHTRDIRLIQAVLGHGSLIATMGYEHVTPSTIRRGYTAAGVVR
jgi:integrase/recombinase XerC